MILKNSPINNISVVTSKESWFVPYAKQLTLHFKKQYESSLFFDYQKINTNPDIIFILSYFKIIPKENFEKHKKNIVIHASNLPKGKGWAPFFWQILEGKNSIPFTMFEITEKIDAGKIYFQSRLKLKGTELHDEIRHKQAKKMMQMCIKYTKNHTIYSPVTQKGEESFYRKRTPLDGKLDINKSIKENFNQLRISSNEDYPAFFMYKGEKYIIKINKES